MAVTDPVDHLAELFASEAGANYLGEAVSLAVHMRQAAALAEQSAAAPYLVAAALLHDVGHLASLGALATGGTERGAVPHEESGAAWLARWFPEAVTEPVRLHVAAKRYLCAVEAGYFERLSSASVASLAEQGGPMTAEQAREFERLPHARDAVAVRRWDEAAKDPHAPTPPFEHFQPLLRALVRAG